MRSVSELNTLRYDPELCIACELCSIVCPHGVFAVGKDRADVVRADNCMECGACQVNCPTGAIEVESGVGCFSAMVQAALRRQPEACCADTCG